MTRTGVRALIGALAICAALPTAAHASFPGTDGRIAFTVGNANASTYSMDPDGTDQIDLTAVPSLTPRPRGSVGGDFSPAYSADAGRIAFSRISGGGTDLWVMNANGNGKTNLTPSTPGTRENDPAFSPDGARIAFIRAPAAGADELVVMNADGSNQQPVSVGAGLDDLGSPDWSPDGSKIAFEARAATRYDVYTVNPDGSGLANVTSAVAGNSAQPSWSPDGALIAFQNQPPGDTDILVMPAGGGGTVNLTNTLTGAFVSQPSFSPSGNFIAYARSETSTVDIFVMNSADGGGQVNLTSNLSGEASRPSWGPTDNAPPQTEITKQPKRHTDKPTAKLKFTSSEPGSTFECSLKGKDVAKRLRPFTPCEDKAKYRHLDDGRKKFRVRAIDPAGNADPTPAKAKWAIG